MRGCFADRRTQRKSLAAMRADLTVIIPKLNEKDLADVPEERNKTEIRSGREMSMKSLPSRWKKKVVRRRREPTEWQE